MSKTIDSLTGSFSILLISGIIFFFLGSSSNVKAQGNLLITPKRVVFNGKKRSQEINLANTGTDTARYMVSFIQIRMKDNGNFEEISQPDSGQNFANKYLRIFPRTVTLGPNEAQVVKIQVSQPGKLLPGEYRSHLYFRAVPKESALGEKQTKVDSTQVSVRLTPVFGISIPVIIRLGELAAKVSLSHLRIENSSESQPLLKARFNRTGSMSVYGDLSAEYISKEGKVTRVGFVKGISVYTPNKIRDIEVKLDNESGINYQSGKLRLLYTTPAEEKSEKLASAELALN